PLKPDLKTLDRGPVRLCQESVTALHRRDACRSTGRTVLRISTFIGNAGQGPLEYAPVSPAQDIPADCRGDGDTDLDGDGDLEDNDVLVQQLIYEDGNGNGTYQRLTDTGFTGVDVGCRYFHPEHDHYHVEAFSRFLLCSEQTGTVVRTGNKISFCVADTNYFDLSLPGAPTRGNGFYSDDDCDGQLSIQGISVGWYDLYAWGLPGQEIDVTGLPAGTYCLIVRADPDNLIDETNESNNDRLRRLFIDPAQAPVNRYKSLPKAPGTCAPL
ncbi:MAG TPA: lysyl oxidase family protein, partial [Nocardioidaceae bacterium]|nr:lysyl oxidase family protein [Nocardioidaceae bacterium]